MNAKWKKFSLAFLTLCLFSVFALLSANAQDPTEGSEPISTTPFPGNENIIKDYAARWEAEFNAFSFSEIRSIYLTDSIIDSAKFATSDIFSELFSAQIVHSWGEAESVLSEAPIDIVFVHASALDQVDSDWLNQAYRDGTLIIGISTPFEELAALIGDSCIKNDNPRISQFFNEWFVYFMYWAIADPSEAKSVVDADTLDNCSEKYEGLVGAATLHSARSRPVTSVHSVEYLANVLRGDIVDLKLQGIALPSQLLPLPVPPSP